MTIQLLKISISHAGKKIRAMRFNPMLRVKRSTVPDCAPKIQTLEKDIFIKEKLPAQNCAGIFRMKPELKNVLSRLSKNDIYNLKFKVNHDTKTISIKENPKLAKAINNFIKEIPEFFYYFRPKTNEPDLAHHVLSTYQKSIQHPEFKKLSPIKQYILEYAALLHDVGKTINSEPEHAKLSVRVIQTSLRKAGVPKDAIQSINKLIEEHHYSYNIKNNIKTYEDYAEEFSKKDFKSLRILCEADLESKEMNEKNLARLAENIEFFRQQYKIYRKKIIKKINFFSQTNNNYKKAVA